MLRRRRRGTLNAENASIAPQEHLGLAHMCARRFARHGISYEELAQQAMTALVAAANRFDATRGLCFSTYAVPCILGELRRYCERNAPMHVPRTDRELLVRADRERACLVQRLGREPSFDELCQTLGLAPERLEALLAARCRAASLLAPRAGEDENEALAARDPDGEDFVDSILLWDAVERLPPPLPCLIRLRFASCLSQSVTAERLGLSQGQVSRLEGLARRLLRETLLC